MDHNLSSSDGSAPTPVPKDANYVPLKPPPVPRKDTPPRTSEENPPEIAPNFGSLATQLNRLSSVFKDDSSADSSSHISSDRDSVSSEVSRAINLRTLYDLLQDCEGVKPRHGDRYLRIHEWKPSHAQTNHAASAEEDILICGKCSGRFVPWNSPYAPTAPPEGWRTMEVPSTALNSETVGTIGYFIPYQFWNQQEIDGILTQDHHPNYRDDAPTAADSPKYGWVFPVGRHQAAVTGRVESDSPEPALDSDTADAYSHYSIGLGL